jgi:putative holliday junction resolvase
MGRILAVDYGTKRVGIAIADPLEMFAQTVGTFDPREAVEEIRKIDGRDVVSTIVVGWPLMQDGSEGPMTVRVQEYVNRLRNAFPDAEVVTWDERHTSEMARTARKDARTKGVRKDPGLDAIAACVILQDYLER